MNIFEWISGALLLISGIIIIVLVILQESKQNGLSGAITGGTSDSYLGKNGGRTKEARLKSFTKFLAVAFFVLTIAVNLVAIFIK